MIKLQNICKFYKNKKSEFSTKALQDVCLTINEGELVAIIGKSGSGKSTLLNIIGGLDKPGSGDYFFLDKNLLKFSANELSKFRNKTVGIIVQNPVLMGEISALENVALPLIIAGKSKNDSIRLSKQALFDVDIADLALRKVNTMSGGEKQRVSIARALVNEPELIIADEPTGALDTANAQVIMKILTNINKSGKTVIVVTHDMDIAKQCNRIITLSDGKIVGDETNTPS